MIPLPESACDASLNVESVSPTPLLGPALISRRATLKEIRGNFEARLNAEEFINRGPSGAGWSYTTRQMLEIERENLALMRDGQGRFRDPLAREQSNDFGLSL